METGKLLEELFDKKILNILRVFLNNPEEEFYLRELSRKTRVPVATVFRIVSKLRSLELIEEHKIKKFKLYSLKKGPNIDVLQQFLEDKRSILNDFIDKIRDLDGLQMVVLHGKEEKNKANLLIIGTGLNRDFIRSTVANIKDRYDYKIIYLTLDPAQFNQMSSMGLYPGKKTILYESKDSDETEFVV